MLGMLRMFGMFAMQRRAMSRRLIHVHDRSRHPLVLDVRSAVMLAALVTLGMSPATADDDLAPEWTFLPVATVLPEALAGGEILGVGPQGVFVVRLGSPFSDHSYHLVDHGQSQQLFARGDEVPGSGTWVRLKDLLIVSADVLILDVFLEGSSESQFFRWESGSITHLPVPAGFTWFLNDNDGQGNFVAWRVLNSTQAEATITDGQQDGPSIVLAWEDDVTESVAGITADGSFLIRGSTQSDNFWSTSVYFRGNRNDVLATAQLEIDGESGQGSVVTAFALNSSGDVLVQMEEEPSGTRTLFLHRPGSPGEVVAQTGSFYSFFTRFGSRISSLPQLFIQANTSAEQGLFTGPNGEADRLDGDFSAFDQPGQILSFATFGPLTSPIFHESGVALFLVRLADQTTVTALGTAALPEITTWTNAAGGEWSEASNWDRLTVPAGGAETLFNLEASYDVEVGARQSGRSRVEAGSVAFRNADLELIGSLSVGGAANLSLPEGRLVADRVVIGHLPFVDEPLPVARLFVSNEGTELRTTASFEIGGAGPGDVLISDATVVSAEVLIGRTHPGAAVLAGPNAFWATESLGLGVSSVGSLIVEHGASLTSETAVIGVGGVEAGARGDVVIDGEGQESPRARWLVTDLIVGGQAAGELQVINGGSVLVTDLVRSGEASSVLDGASGRIQIRGAAGQDSPSQLGAFADALLGGAEGAIAILDVLEGGETTVKGDLYLGWEPGSVALVTIDGTHAAGRRSELRVGESLEQGVTLRVGYHGGGTLTISEGGLVVCDNLLIGGLEGASGTVQVLGAAGELPSELRVTGDRFAVGGVTGLGSLDGVRGYLELGGGYVESPGEVWVGTEGFLTGHGTVVAHTIIANGHVGPAFFPSTPGRKDAAAFQPGNLMLDANVQFGATAVVNLDIHGVDPSLQDRLEITGTAELGGTLELHFGNNYAPQTGDRLSFLSASAGLSGEFVDITLIGLAQGFEFDLEVSEGEVALIALNDATVGIMDGEPGPGPVRPIATLRLLQNQPNPFNPRTVLSYELPGSGRVRLQLFDLRGRLVRTLVDEELAAGRHEAVWDGHGKSGRAQPSGVYVARLQAGEREVSMRLTLVR